MTERNDSTNRTCDKSAWGAGPWQSEPDRVEFEHAGLPCLMVRQPHLGHWCGYAAVPPSHPFHGKDYDSVDVEIHGGLTYASACSGEICHVPKPGEPDDVWWFGFDCAHSGDVSPHYGDRFAEIFREASFLQTERDTYKDVAYVRAETERLAEQFAAITAEVR